MPWTKVAAKKRFTEIMAGKKLFAEMQQGTNEFADYKQRKDFREWRNNLCRHPNHYIGPFPSDMHCIIYFFQCLRLNKHHPF